MKRPRQHALETESRKSFEQMIPNEWACRPFSPDYGIDYQIEIFSKEISEGKAFYVQIKGTDAGSTNDSISLDLEISYFDYFSRLPLPILLVLYCSNTGNFWGIWANKYLDTRKLKKKQKYVRINFDKSNKIDKKFFRQLENDFTTTLHQGKAVFFLTDKAEDSKQFSAILKKWLDTLFPDSLRYKNGKLPLRVTYDIRCNENEIEIKIIDSQIGNFNTKVMITPNDRDFLDYPTYDPQSTPAQLDEVLFVTSILLLDHSTQSSTSVLKRLFPSYAGTYKSFENIVHIARTFITNKLFTEYSEIIDTCIDQSRWEDFQYLNMGIFFYYAKEHSDDVKVRDLYQGNLRKAIAAVPDLSLRGMFCYNLANSMRENYKPKQVFPWYLEAKRHNPNYLKTDYWWKEVAGTLFLSGRYSCAAKCYKHACTLSNHYEADILALTADAFFMAREIDESIKWFDKYLEQEKKPDSEWLLRYRAAKFLSSNNLPKENINRKEAFKKASNAIENKDLDHEGRVAELLSAIELDPLCCLAWFNYSVSLAKHGNQSEAMVGFLVCALTCDWDREAWINTMFMAFSEKNYEICLLVADTVYKKFGRGILNDVASFIKAQPNASHEEKKGLYSGIVGIFDQIDELGGVLKK